MARSSARYHSVLLGVSLFSAQLVATRKVLAHAAHNKVEHTQEKNSQVDASGQPQNSADSATALEAVESETVSIPKADSEASNLPVTAELKNENTVEEVPAIEASSSTARAGLLEGVSLGLGESILALIIAGPFLLRFWKKRVQS